MQRKPHVLILVAVLTAAVAAGAGCDKLRARDKLNKGVNAYKNAQFDEAIEDFKAAEQYDPTLTNAQLYLATAYASQYIPGAPSPENVKNGEQAMAEFKNILDTDPNNVSALRVNSMRPTWSGRIETPDGDDAPRRHVRARQVVSQRGRVRSR